MLNLTGHIKERMKKRNIGGQKIKTLAQNSSPKYLGGGQYKSVKTLGGKKVTLIYKKKDNKKTAITAWKN